MVKNFFESEFFKKIQPYFMGIISLIVVIGIIVLGKSSIYIAEAPCGAQFSEPAATADKNKTTDNIPALELPAAQAEKTCPTNVLEETGSMNKSKSDFWWLNSGGLVQIKGNFISTVQGKLEKNSKWRKLYAKSNARDTENGYQPQNILRLVTRDKWQDLNQSVYFKVNQINLSDSDFRNGSNGVLLFNRYQDGDNLYYTGIRVDGDAVIKKKINGDYYTLDEKQIFSGSDYDRKDHPNSIPLDQWIGIKSEVVNVSSDTVKITLWIDKSGEGNWEKALEFSDTEDKRTHSPIVDAGHTGLRSDFMDVEFRDYAISSI